MSQIILAPVRAAASVDFLLMYSTVQQVPFCSLPSSRRHRPRECYVFPMTVSKQGSIVIYFVQCPRLSSWEQTTDRKSALCQDCPLCLHVQHSLQRKIITTNIHIIHIHRRQHRTNLIQSDPVLKLFQCSPACIQILPGNTFSKKSA